MCKMSVKLYVWIDTAARCKLILGPLKYDKKPPIGSWFGSGDEERGPRCRHGAGARRHKLFENYLFQHKVRQGRNYIKLN